MSLNLQQLLDGQSVTVGRDFQLGEPLSGPIMECRTGIEAEPKQPEVVRTQEDLVMSARSILRIVLGREIASLQTDLKAVNPGAENSELPDTVMRFASQAHSMLVQNGQFTIEEEGNKFIIQIQNTDTQQDPREIIAFCSTVAEILRRAQEIQAETQRGLEQMKREIQDLKVKIPEEKQELTILEAKNGKSHEELRQTKELQRSTTRDEKKLKKLIKQTPSKEKKERDLSGLIDAFIGKNYANFNDLRREVNKLLDDLKNYGVTKKEAKKIMQAKLDEAFSFGVPKNLEEIVRQQIEKISTDTGKQPKSYNKKLAIGGTLAAMLAIAIIISALGKSSNSPQSQMSFLETQHSLQMTPASMTPAKPQLVPAEVMAEARSACAEAGITSETECEGAVFLSVAYEEAEILKQRLEDQLKPRVKIISKSEVDEKSLVVGSLDDFEDGEGFVFMHNEVSGGTVNTDDIVTLNASGKNRIVTFRVNKVALELGGKKYQLDRPIVIPISALSHTPLYESDEAMAVGTIVTLLWDVTLKRGDLPEQKLELPKDTLIAAVGSK